MRQVPLWFERSFEFGFPVEFLPNLCARLRGTPARLEELLRHCPREVLIAKREGKWSPQEQAGHLLDMEPLWMLRVTDYAEGRNELTAADLQNRRTHEAQHNDSQLDEILDGFRAARRQLLSRVEELDAAVFAHALVHPRLRTPMRLMDHLYFVAEHDDHHLAEIWELLRA